MTAVTAPLSKLDAVNMMLASIGQAPVNSLSVSGIRDVNIAALALDNTTREVLSRGWNFNTDQRYPLTPNVSNQILVPSTALEVDPSDRNVDVVVRDNGGTLMLYDRETRSFAFTKPVECDITWGFDYEKLSQAFRQYIAVRAARVFQSQVIGSELLFKFTELHEQEALAALKRHELRGKDRNIFNSGADVNRIFHRSSNPVRY